jgi:hypothetical protein
MQRVNMAARGLFRRIVGTIVTLTAFLVGTLVYVGFYTKGYDVFQKVVVLLVGFILAIAIVTIMWVSWAGRHGWIREQWGP